MLNQLKQNYKLVFFDMAIIAIVPFLSLFIRLEGHMDMLYLATLKLYMPYIILINIGMFYFYGLYRRLWRYATIHDLFTILAAVTSAAIVEILGGIYFDVNLPNSTYMISLILMIGAIGCNRLIYKFIYFNDAGGNQKDATRVLIVGAGDAGAMLAREIRNHNEEKKRKIIGYIDDDRTKIGSQLFNTVIMGNCADIERIVEEEKIDEIIIAIPSAGSDVIREIIDSCQKTTCKISVLPSIYELIADKSSLQQLRDISLEDLLCREAVSLDIEQINLYIKDKCVLVTGAGGSIGAELCRKISKFGARQIILLGRGENSIYEIHQELLARFSYVCYVPIIADIRDKSRLKTVFEQYCPEIIFHAAAHKHVPLMEMQPEEAIKNNIFGTKNMAELANQFGCKQFIMISTDKAVNPTSVMGATKRIAEFILQQMNSTSSNTKYSVVRFGNVLGSRGSVVPLFEKQISRGGPITITHPEITRYFMTIPEAVQLVLQAGALARGGDLFLLNMGQPVKILDMAKELIRLHGLIPEQDIKIIYTGLRPGEKLYEELLTVEEGAISTAHKKIFSAQLQAISSKELQECLTVLEHTADRNNILYTLKRLIPTYKNELFKANKKAVKVS